LFIRASANWKSPSQNNGSIVIAANSGFSNSTDGGQTFTFRGGTPGPNGSVDGDPSLGVGVSGARSITALSASLMERRLGTISLAVRPASVFRP